MPPAETPPELAEAFAARLEKNRRAAAWALAPESDDSLDVSSEGERQVAASPTGESLGTGTSLDSEGPGGQIGPYKILREIGEGGFGTVFEAEQLAPVKRHVAVKIIKLGMDTREVIARFEAERQALAMMDHPHVAKVFDAGTSAKGRPYFVMELVPGEAITRYCDRHKLTIAERLELFDQVCQAVQHAHAKGIIHRDLKPNNILITTHDSRPFAKVIDFGIAKATGGRLDGGTALTQQQMIGTPLYMSPEQAEGSADIDTRTDIYALGVILYELVAGSTPFESVSFRSAGLAEMQRIICEVEPTLPSARLMQHAITPSDVAEKRSVEPHRLRATLRDEIDWIVMKAIEKDRQRRYPTANALALDIQKYLTGQPVTAAPPSKSYRLRKWTARNKGAVAAAVLITVSLLGGMLSFAWQARIIGVRAAELERVAKFQAEMLRQVDPAAAGELLKKDMTAMFEESLAKTTAPQAERAAAQAAFALQWQHVNATDVARNLIGRTILEPAVAAIDEQFKDLPIVDAALRQELAERYMHIGLSDKALPLQEAALATRRHSLGESHPDTLRSFKGTGAVLMVLGKPGKAEAYYRMLLHMQRGMLGEDHHETLISIIGLATILQAQGKLSEAEPFLRQGLEKNRRVVGEDHPLVLTSLMSLAILLQRQGKLSEAEVYFREALDKYRRVLGAEHYDTLTTLMALGNVLRNQGKLGEAEPYLRDALEKIRHVRGNEHPITLIAIAGMGNLLRLQGKLDEAEPLMLEALQTSRRVMGEEDPTTLSAINNLGALLVAQGKQAEAFELLAAAEAATRRTSVGGLSFRLATFLTSLGMARLGLDERVAAESDLLEALDIFETNPGPNPQDRRECTEALVALYAGWDAESPGKGYDEKARIWQGKLAKLDGSLSL